MVKMKTKIAIVILIVSTLLMLGLPQYTFASSQQGDQVNQPQVTVSTSPTPSIPRFSITASPIYVDIGQTGTSTLSVKSLNGFSGTVDLDVASVSGLILKIEPKSLTIEKGKTATATLSVKVQPKMDLGKTILQVTGSSGSLIVKANVNVLVPDFSIKTNPTTLYLVAGETKTSTITAASIYHFSGTIALSTSTLQGWQHPILAKNSLTVTYPATTTTPSTDSTTLTVSAPTNAQTGKYVITVTGEHEVQGESKDIVHTRDIVVQVIKPDFRLSASPSTIYIQPGQSGSSTIRIASIGRFQGSVQLSILNPTGLAGTLTSPSLSIEVNQAGTVTLNVPTTSATPAGKYPIQITATSGSLSHVITIMVQVIKPDFAIISSPELLTVKAGTTPTAIIKAISINRYEGTVTIAAATTPPAGITLIVDPSPVYIKYNQAGIVKVTFNIPANIEPGKYIIDFKGTATPPAFSGINVDTTSIKIVVTP
jgi:uncharacterized membrane protein